MSRAFSFPAFPELARELSNFAHVLAPHGVSARLTVLQRNAAPSVSALQTRTYAAEAKASPTEVSSILEQRIRGVHEEANLAETGRVLSVGYVIHNTLLGGLGARGDVSTRVQTSAMNEAN